MTCIQDFLFLTAPYVKVYLVSGKKCIAKAKTATARKTLDPLYQQQLAFREPFQGCILQVMVVGSTFPSDFLMLALLCLSVILRANLCVFGVVLVPHRNTRVLYPACRISA